VARRELGAHVMVLVGLIVADAVRREYYPLSAVEQ
jgi:hypothetical protein